KSAAAALAVATLVTTGAGVYAYQQPGRGGRARAAAPAGSGQPAENTYDPARAALRAAAAPAGSGQPARNTYNPAEPVDGAEGPSHFRETLRDHDAALFGHILNGRKQWDANAVDRLAHWSRAVKDAEEYLSNDPANVTAARQAHRDRMKRLHELTQT